MTDWHYIMGDGRRGKATPDGLRELAFSGSLRPDDLVWKEGCATWIPARSVEGLFPPPLDVHSAAKIRQPPHTVVDSSDPCNNAANLGGKLIGSFVAFLIVGWLAAKLFGISAPGKGVGSFVSLGVVVVTVAALAATVIGLLMGAARFFWWLKNPSRNAERIIEVLVILGVCVGVFLLAIGVTSAIVYFAG